MAVPRLVWHQCASPEQQGFQCATARVPLNYSNPRGPTIHLAVIRHPASDRAHRIGTLFFNPGGPGASGTAFLPLLVEHFPPALQALPNRLRGRARSGVAGAGRSVVGLGELCVADECR